MVGDLERRLVELRFIEGIEKVEHVPYRTGDQFWVRFNSPLDLGKLENLVNKHGYIMVRFATLPSKLPRGLSEMLWDGVTHVIAKKMSGWSKFTSSLGLEPEGIAKIADDLHGQYQIFIATTEEGVQLLYEYLGLKYVPPAPPQLFQPNLLYQLRTSQFPQFRDLRRQYPLLQQNLRRLVNRHNPPLHNRGLPSNLEQYLSPRSQRQTARRKKRPRAEELGWRERTHFLGFDCEGNVLVSVKGPRIKDLA